MVVLTVEVASFDVRFGGGLVRERYLFYLTPVILTAAAAALSASQRPRWSILAPLAVCCLGFWKAPLGTYRS